MPTKIFMPLGVRLDTVGSAPEFGLGDFAWGQDNSKWVYVLAGSIVAQYACVGLDKAFTANPITKAHADAGRKVGVAQVAFAAGQYGWVATQGGNDLLKVKAKNSCQPAVALYTTGTAGYLDDTAASQTLVNGIVLTDTATASGASKTCSIMTEAFPTPAP
jgi:hypothetical protein